MMKKKLTMRYPSAWHGEMWREAAPCGNGLIGMMVYGGVMKEIILLNHAFLWRGGDTQKMPDVSDTLPKIRQLLDDHNPLDADLVLTNTLQEQGYSGGYASPTPVCDITFNTRCKDTFKNYRRVIDMEKAEITISYKEGEASFKRSTFVSRSNNLVFARFTCENGLIDTDITLCLHDPETMGGVQIPNQDNFADSDNNIFFAAENISTYHAGDYGAVGKVFTDGVTKTNGSVISVSGASEILVVVNIFVATSRKEAFTPINGIFDYHKELSDHEKLHKTVFGAVDFTISDTDTSNEELLLDAFDNEASNELIEKLYAYGRYLFICSTSDKDTLPCHLTGLFNGTYNCFWAFYMYNINFEMIYWQALNGNLPSYLRLALDYTENLMCDFRDNASKTFGCRGILINSVNTPETGISKCLHPHILYWTGGAAWFSQHFWDYYRFTDDADYLKNHALPFMYETALFYEDFVVENADGYYDIYPSISPENTPGNVKALVTGWREIETTKNATMEFALLKEVITNLISGCKITGMYPEKQAKWIEMLSKIRPYMVNKDGAIKEWIDDFYDDNYCHRHHSHVYPIFPGCEVTKNDDIYKAFEKAENLRLKFGLSDQSSWSMVFISGIAARMERAELALKVIDTISRTCLMNNFLTLHNDWRRMGPIMCADLRVAPFQIDGNIGIPATINEMILQSQMDDLFILPALPVKWEKGHLIGLLARGNIICDIFWDNDKGYAILKSKKPKQKLIRLGSTFIFDDNMTEKVIDINNEVYIKFKRDKKVSLPK
jgi:alpha-L-fucosidase 2